MWCSSKSQAPAARLLVLVMGLAIAALASGCMSDPAAGDLPWAKQEKWEGSPALPSGMFQNR